MALCAQDERAHESRSRGDRREGRSASFDEQRKDRARRGTHQGDACRGLFMAADRGLSRRGRFDRAPEAHRSGCTAVSYGDSDPHREGNALRSPFVVAPAAAIGKRGKGRAVRPGMKGQGSEIAFPDAILRCADFPQSAFRLWVKRPGQDLNLRGVTHRFSRPAPYRTRRPGQRFILRPKTRIRVPETALARERLSPESFSMAQCM